MDEDLIVQAENVKQRYIPGDEKAWALSGVHPQKSKVMDEH